MNTLDMPFAMIRLVQVASFTRNFVVVDFGLRIHLDSLCLPEALLAANLESCVLVFSP